MRDPISIYRYSLVSRSALNSRSEKVEHQGALIRVGDGDYGYGCIHPWPELVDLDLEETLGRLKMGETTPLIRQALHCAARDAEARRKGVSLFDGLEVPLSHATVELDKESFVAAWGAGFKTVKVKVGKDLVADWDRLVSLAYAFPDFRWRLDFNHSCSLREVEGFLRSLGDSLCGKIDFIEDAWGEEDTPGSHVLGVALAVDRSVMSQAEDFPVSVVKPARDELEEVLERVYAEEGRVVITSYMDHPIGQSYAAWQAGLAMAKYPSMVDSCGLITHGLFEPDAFTECLGNATPHFHPAPGTGLGFDDLLESMTWTPLV